MNVIYWGSFIFFSYLLYSPTGLVITMKRKEPHSLRLIFFSPTNSCGLDLLSANTNVVSLLVKNNFSPFRSSNEKNNEKQLADNGFKLIPIEKICSQAGLWRGRREEGWRKITIHYNLNSHSIGGYISSPLIYYVKKDPEVTRYKQFMSSNWGLAPSGCPPQ